MINKIFPNMTSSNESKQVNNNFQASNTKVKQNKGITGIIMNQEALQKTLLIIH